MTESRASSQRFRRIVRVGALVLLALQLAYLLAANLFLNTGLAPLALNRKPEKLDLHWRRAWSVIPGLVHLDGVRLRAQSRPVQWYLEAERARIWIRLTRLGFKHLSARDVAMTDVVFHLRGRSLVTTGDVDCTLQPPIPNWDCGPSGSPDLGPHSMKPNPWAFTFSQVEANAIRRLWLDRFQYQGVATAAGSFQFEIRGPFQMDHARAHLESGTLLIGDRQATSNLRLDAHVRFDPFVPQETDPRDRIQYLSGTLDLDTQRSDLGFLAHLIRGAPWLTLNGEGRIHGHVELTHGQWTSASRLNVDDAHLQVNLLDFSVQGTGDVRAQVVPDADTLWTELAATVDHYTLGNGEADTLVRGRGLTLQARGAASDWNALSPQIESTIHIPPADLPDLRLLNAYLPGTSGVRFDAGQGTIGGHLSLTTADLSGQGQLEVATRNASWMLAGERMRGDVTLHAQLEDADPVERRFRLGETKLDLQASLAQDQEHVQPWTAHIKVNEGTLRLTQPIEVDAAFQADVSDSRPLVALLTARKRPLRWLRPLLAVENIDLDGQLRMDEQAIHLQRVTLDSDGVDVQADLWLADNRPTGHVLVELGRFAAAVALAEGKRDWKLTRARRW